MNWKMATFLPEVVQDHFKVSQSIILVKKHQLIIKQITLTIGTICRLFGQHKRKGEKKRSEKQQQITSGGERQ
jgi:hypothetical protein